MNQAQFIDWGEDTDVKYIGYDPQHSCDTCNQCPGNGLYEVYRRNWITEGNFLKPTKWKKTIECFQCLLEMERYL